MVNVIETILRISLGLRFLHSGFSNIQRWPNPVDNARLVFPFGATFFGYIAVILEIAGGTGLILGIQTHIAASMIVLFMIPTLKIHYHWLCTLPPIIEEVNNALLQHEDKRKFSILAGQAYHSHEIAWQNNLLFLIVALFFTFRGSVTFGLDNWIQ
jgi:uncharacterized membrane protein YphA (DoxX/SURF4 family)